MKYAEWLEPFLLKSSMIRYGNLKYIDLLYLLVILAGKIY